MTKAKVQLYGQNRVVTIETDATKGAVVGENLYLRDGTLVTESMLFPQQQSNNPPITYWRLIQEVPPNVTALANAGDPAPSSYFGTDASDVVGWHPVVDSYVPFFIPDGDIFTIPANKQALFTLPIELDGDAMLILDGALVEVN